MKSRYYKIKNTKTAEFWTGYSTQFSKRGAEYKSIEDAGTAIAAQLKLKHSSIQDWLPHSEVVEFEVIIKEQLSFASNDAIKLSTLYLALQREHGTDFLAGFKKMTRDPSPVPDLKYAVEIIRNQYDDFTSTLKGLGFSSRTFKKVGSWIWFGCDDLGIRIKLIGGHTKFVDLTDHLAIVNEVKAILPPDSVEDDAEQE
jgi:hypothetical protein